MHRDPKWRIALLIALALGASACDDDDEGGGRRDAGRIDGGTTRLDGGRRDAAVDRDGAVRGDGAVVRDGGGRTDGGGDAGPPAAAIAPLQAAFTRQLELTSALTAPELANDPAAIRAAVTAAAPLLEEIGRQLQLALASSPPEGATQYIAAAIAEHEALVAIAQTLGAAPDDAVAIRFAEAVTHGAVSLSSTNVALSTLGAGPSAPGAGHVLTTADLVAPAGYTVEIVANRLSFASAVEVAFDGTIYVAEAGYSYGNVRAPARVLRVANDGSTEVVAEGFEGPVAGLALLDDRTLFVVHRGTVSRIDLPTGARTDIVTGLPAGGDHYTENAAIGPDGRLYFTQGTVTNTGVVGLDNYFFGWLPNAPTLHEIPCRDYTLTGQNFTTGNPLTASPTDTVTTGAFVPFGTPTVEGQVIRGSERCSGAVYRVMRDGSGLEVYADGLRNPYGLAFHPDGRLFATENGPDSRGSRPIEAPDNLYEIREGGWYGFPDYYGGVPVTEVPTEGQRFERVLASPPPLATRPLAQFPVHSAATGLDFSSNASFAPVGTAFVALLGDLTPPTAGGEIERTGRYVATVSPTGVLTPFLTSGNYADGEAFLRPTDATFSEDGQTLYVTHFGELRAVPGGILPTPGTGALLRIRRVDTAR
jgi:glucose/arabinose dehydrogenase